MAAFRYVALNPVKAGLVQAAADWPWASIQAHIAGRGTPYVEVAPGPSIDEARWGEVLKAELIGRPVGAEEWVRGLEERLGRDFLPKKRGPKPKGGREEEDGRDLFR